MKRYFWHLKNGTYHTLFPDSNLMKYNLQYIRWNEKTERWRFNSKMITTFKDHLYIAL